MALNLFKKKSSKTELKTKIKPEVQVEQTPVGKVTDKVSVLANHHYTSQALDHIHVSEKASRLTSLNQYVFRVKLKANKQEIKKHIEQMFNVKVAAVRVLNMPSKARNVGRQSGIKSGYRKAIATLKEGYTIQEAKS